MRYRNSLALAGLVLPMLAMPALAQTTVASRDTQADSGATSTAPSAKKGSDEGSSASLTQPIVIQHVRPVDQRGINVFEWPKQDNVPFTGFKLGFGAAFTQQYQGLDHKNTAAPRPDANGVNQNQLIQIGHGFNNAVANLYIDAQLAKGIRVSMTSYLSARHHQESWVKDGYLLIDDSPIDNPLLNNVMKYVTVRAGHFEVNYGDQHFRRTDNGNAMYNPFVGNLILDAFTTEIGGEVYLRPRGALDGVMVMGGVTAGEVHGQVTAPQKRSPALLGKVGYDKQLNQDLRVRLTGSLFTQDKAASQTLFGGDRAGSRYYDVMENTASSETSQAWSGNLRSPFGSKVTAMVFNPFIKYRGLELFGNIEQAKGRNATERSDRTVTQNAIDAVYRFAGDRLYVGGRYNTVSATLPLTNAGTTANYDVSIDRTQFGGGWFITPTVLTKIEYVTQKYNDFPTFDIRNGGQFQGFMIEGSVAF